MSNTLAGGRFVPADDGSSDGRRQLAEHTRMLLVEARQVGDDRRAGLVNEAVESHLWLADSLARRYQYRGEELDDLIQVARSGLVEAAQRYDPEAGAFVNYAVPTITGLLKRHFRDHGWLVRPPRPTQEIAAQLRKQWPQLAQSLQSQPTDGDLARQLGKEVGAVREAKRASQSYRATSLDAAAAVGIAPVAEDGHADLERAEARLVIMRAWSQLNADEQRLIRLRFFDDRSQSDIAARIGTSQMQVSRLLSRALRRMREIVGESGAEPALL